ncbi:MAG TPA: ABC transporter permease [Bryobacteraceae bacterium]
MKRFKFFLRKSAIEKELDSEIRFHVDSVIQQKIAAGLSPEQARWQARLEFGGGEQVKEECRDAHRLALIETTLANLRSAFRFMRRSPGFSAIIIVTLALGIGANSAVFSAINAVLLRPLPYPEPGELVVLHQYNRTKNNPPNPIAPVRLEEWNKDNSTFQAIAGSYTQSVSEASGSSPERLVLADVTPRFFQVLGISPELGRDFTPAEEHFGGPHAVLISDRLWHRLFHADPHVLGKTLRFDSFSVPIVGVLPPSFHFPDKDVDIWSPVPMDAPIVQDRSFTWFTGIGRIKPGVTVARARADLDTVQARLARQFPKTDKNLMAEIQPLKETVVSGSRRSLWILFGAVTLLLLIACTNIAALLLSRTTRRAHEISIRYALGASRGSIIAQLLTEAFVLAIAGSVLGLGIAAAAIRVFHSMAKALPRVDQITLDWQLVLYTLGCALVATLLCALVPALIASRRSISSTLSSISRTQVSARAPLQWTLVGVQVALAVILLVGAGLLLRSFQELGRVSPGFDPNHVLTLRISGNYAETNNQKKMLQSRKRMLDGIAAVPGVESAAISASVPGATSGYPVDVKVTGAAVSPDRKITANEELVYGPYFKTLRIPILAGSTCKEDKLWATAVVNRSFVETYFPNQTVIGRHLTITAVDPKPEIVGVVGDAREDGLNQAPVPTFYWCSPNSNPSPYFLIRTHGKPLALANTLRRKIHQVAPSRSVFDVMPLKQHLYESDSEARFRTLLLSLFALTAISLAALGIYGTLSYLVALRQREIGLRMALGALPGQIRNRFLVQGLSVSLVGCIAGLALAASLSRLLASMLYDVSRLDPLTYAAVAIGVLAVAALASAVPAGRAAHLDPMQVLRQE